MTDPLLTPIQGMMLIVGYAAAMLLLTQFAVGRVKQVKEQYLVGNRQIGMWQSSFSIAATWIWAPALFLASTKAYTQGIAGLFWFTVPNILCLIIFAWFADRVRNKMPQGFTFSDFMQKRYSQRVQNAYIFQFSGLAVCSFAVQLLAGGKVIASLTGISYFWVTIGLSLTALIYAVLSGIRASVVTDYVQMILILITGIILVPWIVIRAGGWSVLTTGFGGISGKHSGLFSVDSLSVAWYFGVPVTIGLLAGPFGDQSFWQRAFSVKREAVRGAFVRGALLFSIVPLTMSLLGFAAVGSGHVATDVGLVNLEMAMLYLPVWALVIFVVMLMSGLGSTLDSCLCAISSLVGHDVLERLSIKRRAEYNDYQVIFISRLSMIVLAILALMVANIPNMKILHLFLFYGTLRAATLLPTVLTVSGIQLKETGVFWGIVIAIIAGLPVFAYGNFSNNPNLAVIGSIMTVIFSGSIAWGMTWISTKLS